MANHENPIFILGGTGPYENKGCEAILRGTVEILRNFFPNPRFIVVNSFLSDYQYRRQKSTESDESVVHKKTVEPDKKISNPLWFLDTVDRLMFPEKSSLRMYREVISFLENCKAVLSVAGDNYSLDYRRIKFSPRSDRYVGLDNIVLKRNKPLIIWGASIGPFDRYPRYERFMMDHLKRVDGIFARESVTIDYSNSKGVTENLYRVADPAFLLDAVEPVRYSFDKEILKASIGLNLSPLMAKYVTKGNTRKWVRKSVEIIEAISADTGRPIYLVPHVIRSDSNDYAFLGKVLYLLKKPREKIELIPPDLTSAETKWLIGNMLVFAGSRTHSTIAAISSGVPTLNFAYSIKAKGIFKDVFGHDDFCIYSQSLSTYDILEKIHELIGNSNSVRKHLENVLPEFENLAMDSGRYLKQILGYRTCQSH